MITTVVFEAEGAGYLALARERNDTKEKHMGILLLILAAILVIAGIFSIIRGQLLWGIVLIVVGLAVGPGGYSIFA